MTQNNDDEKFFVVYFFRDQRQQAASFYAAGYCVLWDYENCLQATILRNGLICCYVYNATVKYIYCIIMCYYILYQRWANYGPWAACGPPNAFLRPAKNC